MATLKKYNMQGKEVGSFQIEDALLETLVESGAHSQSIKDYIVAIRNNARQWSANTKVRKEINRTGRKPHPQKGQGRSRQGDLAAPQYKGGGIVFGPKPKFGVHVRINKKERRAAIRTLLAEKIKAGRVHVLQRNDIDVPKTKAMFQFFEQIEGVDKRVLVLGESNVEMKGRNENLVKSFRNIPRKEYVLMPQVNGYDIARSHTLIVLDSALPELHAMLGA